MSQQPIIYRQQIQPSKDLPPQLNDLQQEQRMRLQMQQIQARVLEERPNFQDMQGGQPPQKEWLGEDVYVVAFLLSVEVDRLREENTQLSQYVNGNEVRYKGVDLVENEIIQQRIKIGEYEKRLAQLSNECEQWRAKYQSREKDSEETRYQAELQRRIQIDREIRELTARFISDRNQLEQENRQLRNELDSLKLQKTRVDDVSRQSDVLLKENQSLKVELENLRKGFDELEYVLKTAQDLEQENSYLKQQLENVQKNQSQVQIIKPESRINLENKRLKDENDRLKTILNLGKNPQLFM